MHVLSRLFVCVSRVIVVNAIQVYSNFNIQTLELIDFELKGNRSARTSLIQAADTVDTLEKDRPGTNGHLYTYNIYAVAER